MQVLGKDQAVILKGVGGQYSLHRQEDDFRGLASLRGVLRLDAKVPCPGDIVSYQPSGDPDIPYQISSLAERKNSLLRPALANLDCLLIVVSIAKPGPDYLLIDLLASYATALGIEVAILVTKLDLIARRRFARTYEEILAIYSQFQLFSFNSIDAKAKDDLALLEEFLAGKISAMTGKSGVGKSSLLNRLFKEEKMPAGAISAKGQCGRQTTRHTELFPLASGYLADSPGFSSLNVTMLDLDGFDFANSFPEIKAIKDLCKYRDCRHLGEEDCAISQAKIHPRRLANYRQMRLSLDEFNKTSY